MLVHQQELTGGDRLLRCMFLALLAIVPTIFALITWYFPIMHTASIPILGGELLVILVLFLSLGENGVPFRLPGRWSLLAGFLLIAIGAAGAALNAPDPADSTLYLSRTLMHLVLAALLFQALTAHWHGLKRPILHAMLVGAILQIAFSYFVIAYGANTGDIDWAVFVAGANNVRQLCFIGIVVTSISAGLAACSSNRKQFVIYCLGLVVGMTFLDLNGGRAGIFAGLGSVALAVMLSPTGLKTRNSLSFLACVVVSMPLSLIYVPPDDSWGFMRTLNTLFGEGEQGVTSPGRTVIWGVAYERFLDNPLIGNGEGQFRFFDQIGPTRFNHPHNVLLQSLFQWGALGTACAAFLFARPLLGVRAALCNDPVIAITSISGAAGLSAMSMLDGSLYYAYPTMMAVVFLVLIDCSAVPSNQPTPPAKDR